MLAGPVESVSLDRGYFFALGQKVYAELLVLEVLEKGDYVGVAGAVFDSGEIVASNVVRTSVQYVAGATEIFVTGLPSRVDYRRGTATIGELTMDYTMSDQSQLDVVPAAITVFGTQPTSGGIMLTTKIEDTSLLVF